VEGWALFGAAAHLGSQALLRMLRVFLSCKLRVANKKPHCALSPTQQQLAA